MEVEYGQEEEEVTPWPMRQGTANVDVVPLRTDLNAYSDRMEAESEKL
jgi:hypothetical protein